ncbi:nuclear transport factor 2 family protein [bacterium]|nr:MAG: nuclear transport factor 2 family protein [bacterium]
MMKVVEVERGDAELRADLGAERRFPTSGASTDHKAHPSIFPRAADLLTGESGEPCQDRLVLVFSFLPLFGALSLQEVPKLSPVESTLQAFAEAVRTLDGKALEPLLHRDYVEVSPLGDVDPRVKVLSYYEIPAENRPKEYPKFRMEDLIIRTPTSDTAVAIFKQTAIFATGPMKGERSFRATAMLRKEGDKWLMYSFQATPLRPAKPVEK